MKTKVRLLCFFLFLSSCGHQLASQQKISPFKTDICTLFPNQSKGHPHDWSHCCVAHDISYWLGGPESRRQKVDEELKACVKKTGASEAGDLMYTGVFVGGTPYLQTPWAWGFGRHGSKSYSDFSQKERRLIAQQLPTVLDVLQTLKKRWSSEQRQYLMENFERVQSEFSNRQQLSEIKNDFLSP